ncbi:MAG: PDZ domain-containing protein [Burkholderiales bacterium]|nr:PDZ domain-containing protein [Burkholderiales bacterium]
MKKIISFGLLALLAGCGGGGGNSGVTSGTSGTTPPVTPPVTSTLPASDTLANLCQTPRTGTDPFNNNQAFPDKQGTLANEKTWLRSWIDETYLWYKEVPTTLNPESYATAIDYFDVLKTSAKTASGNAKDRFHFTYPTAAWNAMSQQGVELGYGISWGRVATKTLPRKWVVAIVEPGSPAKLAGLQRGDQLFSVDDADFLNGNDKATIAAINAGLFPEKEGESHKLVVTRNNVNVTVTVAAANVVAAPVQNTTTIDTPSGKVGYLTFNDHNAVSEAKLIDSITQLKTAGISDLVLDLRYNGGGLLYVASELAYMIAGPEQTTGKTFEQTQFNDKFKPDAPTPFLSTAYGFSAQKGQALPYLGLKKVTILTSSGTCSASEAIINGLQGVDVEVNLIGGQTCGKPYGFYPTPNCGTTYFAIQFKGVNNKGFGDYADGIPATCNVADDFTHALGDKNEGQLAAALSYRNTKTCPAATTGIQLQAENLPQKFQMVRPVAKEIAIYSKLK